MSVRQLLARRRALAARLGGVQQVLSGSLAEQARRCGKAGCRCAAGEADTARTPSSPRGLRAAAGRGTSRAALAGGRAPLPAHGEEVEAVLAEISAINAELLARRELS